MINCKSAVLMEIFLFLLLDVPTTFLQLPHCVWLNKRQDGIGQNCMSMLGPALPARPRPLIIAQPLIGCMAELTFTLFLSLPRVPVRWRTPGSCPPPPPRLLSLPMIGSSTPTPRGGGGGGDSPLRHLLYLHETKKTRGHVVCFGVRECVFVGCMRVRVFAAAGQRQQRYTHTHTHTALN